MGCMVMLGARESTPQCPDRSVGGVAARFDRLVCSACPRGSCDRWRRAVTDAGASTGVHVRGKRTADRPRAVGRTLLTGQVASGRIFGSGVSAAALLVETVVLRHHRGKRALP